MFLFMATCMILLGFCCVQVLLLLVVLLVAGKAMRQAGADQVLLPTRCYFYEFYQVRIQYCWREYFFSLAKSISNLLKLKI